MARFSKAIEVVLAHEGGFVDDPDDPGGATHWGVSLRFLRTLADENGDGWLDGDLDQDGDVDVDDIRSMTVEEAKEIYRRQWWDRYAYRKIRDQAVATKTFDLAVNMGPARAHRLLQQALGAAGFPVEVDGKIGPKTRAAIGAATHGYNGWLLGLPGNVAPVVAAFRSEAAGYYRFLAATDAKRGKYLRGWLRRAYF